MNEVVRRFDGCDYFFDWRDAAQSDEVKQLALEMAIERGGQTMPVSSFDIENAFERITGEKNELVRLRRENRVLRAELRELKARQHSPAKDD